jgi:hypothetical protein
MSITEETLAAMGREMQLLLESVLTKARVVLEEAEQATAKGLAEVAKERAKMLIEVAKERDRELAVVDARRGELHREIAAMHTHKEAQEGRVVLDIGGYRYTTSVQALRRVPHTFFDAYFSGRYAQDVCDDGSIFVDRDGEHFGHVLQYMRDGVVAVAEPGAQPSVSLLRALKREFGFYCIEVGAEPPATGQVWEQVQPGLAFVIGGLGGGDIDHSNGYDSDDEEILSSMERYDSSSGEYNAVAAMGTARHAFGACVVAGEIYVTGGRGRVLQYLLSVEKFSPSSNTYACCSRCGFGHLCAGRPT